MKHYAKEKEIEFPTDCDFTITATLTDAPVLPMLASLHNPRKARRLHKRCKKMGVTTYQKLKYIITK